MLEVDRKAIDIVKKVIPEIALIEDAQLREKVERIWAYAWRESKWDDINQACFEFRMPEFFLVDHVRVTALGAVAMADIVKKVQGIELDREAVLVGALLHDVSKLLEYEPAAEKGKAQLSELGKKIQHSIYGAHLMLEEGLSLDLVHAVITHTAQSNIKPFLPEAVIVQLIDHADARLLFTVSHEQVNFPALK